MEALQSDSSVIQAGHQKLLVRDFQVEFEAAWFEVTGNKDVIKHLSDWMLISQDFLLGMRMDFKKIDFAIGGVSSDGFWVVFAKHLEFTPGFAEKFQRFRWKLFQLNGETEPST